MYHQQFAIKKPKLLDLSKLLGKEEDTDQPYLRIWYEIEEKDQLEAQITHDEIYNYFEDFKKGKTD